MLTRDKNYLFINPSYLISYPSHHSRLRIAQLFSSGFSIIPFSSVRAVDLLLASF